MGIGVSVSNCKKCVPLNYEPPHAILKVAHLIEVIHAYYPQDAEDHRNINFVNYFSNLIRLLKIIMYKCAICTCFVCLAVCVCIYNTPCLLH